VSADKSIPARASLEQYRKQAKDLVKERARLLPDALERIRRHHPRLRELGDAQLRAAPFSLSDAQLVLAREHAFKTWPEFARHVASTRLQPSRNRYVTHIDADGVHLEAEVSGIEAATALVLLVQASGSRGLASTRFIVDALNSASLCTVTADLLTDDEATEDASTETLHYDLRLLARRIVAITNWIERDVGLRGLKIGCFSSGTGAAAALVAAAERPDAIQAVVSGAGRPDLAGPWLTRVRAPALFLVGARDSTVILAFTGSALKAIPRDTGLSLQMLEGTSRQFTESPLREKVTSHAIDWFRSHLSVGGRRP